MTMNLILCFEMLIKDGISSVKIFFSGLQFGMFI